ncbi:MAG: hypothetical protein GY699_13310 [Desulfobacteraceae bacterium]|nr:hypothetical protein [Desulfobacteraceae bacterium]
MGTKLGASAGLIAFTFLGLGPIGMFVGIFICATVGGLVFMEGFNRLGGKVYNIGESQFGNRVYHSTEELIGAF